MTELISVIVPVYNVEKFLCRCIESIQNQTYENIEILMIDDGSTDCSSKICDEYAAKDTRIRVVHKKNGGLSSARNVGLDVARGDYIFFVDSDDYIDSNTLSIMLERLQESDADMSVCGYTYVDEKGRRIEQDASDDCSDDLLSGKHFLARNYLREGKTDAIAWNKLYKRKIFEKLRFDLGKLHEDEFIFHKVCARCNTVAVVGEELYFYTQREDSIMKNYDYNRGVDVLEAILHRILYMKSMQDEEMNKACSNAIEWFFNEAFKYSHALGFDNKKLNILMKNLRRQVLYFLPVLFRDSSLSLKKKIAFSIWLFSPKTYGVIKGE